MTKNIIHLKDHQFKPGFDQRRNIKGAPKGKNFRYAFGQQMFEKHKVEIEEVVAKVIQRAVWGHDQSQKLVFDYFVTKPIADITVDYCDDTPIIENLCHVPKDILENMRSSLVDVLSQYSNNDSKEGNEE